MNIYYIYFYLNEDFTPYYIGKGKGKRAWRKREHETQVPTDNSKIILVEQNLTEVQSFILERYYIKWFGRKDLGTGILLNKTDGGQGIDSETARINALKRAKEGTHPFQKDSNGESFASRKVKEGTHNLLRRADGTSVSSDRVKSGECSLLKRNDGFSWGKFSNEKRLKEGTHNLKDSVFCKNSLGESKYLSKQEYQNQKGPKKTWEWKTYNTGMITCVNKKGEFKNIEKDFYYSQTGPKCDWEWVHNRSKEAKSRNNASTEDMIRISEFYRDL